MSWSQGATIIYYRLTSVSGHDPSKLFQRSVNKRYVPDYYDIIKEPMALSILKQKINKKEYKRFAEFVRDCALVCSTTSSTAVAYLQKLTFSLSQITHNAQTYNRPNSRAYEDALVIKVRATDIHLSDVSHSSN